MVLFFTSKGWHLRSTKAQILPLTSKIPAVDPPVTIYMYVGLCQDFLASGVTLNVSPKGSGQGRK